MTTTETASDIITCEECKVEPAEERVMAQHFDPDLDDDGRAGGWSRAIVTDLCPSCLAQWHDDEIVFVIQAVPL
jgi:hypothetical protein